MTAWKMERSADRLYDIAEDAIYDLYLAAKCGERRDAGERLTEIASYACARLRMLRSSQEKFDEHKNRMYWPTLLSAHRGEREREVASVLEGLGSAIGLNFQGRKSWSIDSPINQVAFHLFEDIDLYRRGGESEDVHSQLTPQWIAGARKLHKFSRAVVNDWWAFANELLPIKFGSDFERHREFRVLKKNNSNASPAELRSIIVNAIKQGFETIAEKCK